MLLICTALFLGVASWRRGVEPTPGLINIFWVLGWPFGLFQEGKLRRAAPCRAWCRAPHPTRPHHAPRGATWAGALLLTTYPPLPRRHHARRANYGTGIPTYIETKAWWGSGLELFVARLPFGLGGAPLHGEL